VSDHTSTVPAKAVASEHWSASTRVVWGLFGLVGMLLGLGVANAMNEIRDHEHRIRTLERDSGVIVERLKALDEIKADLKELKARIPR
jgi:hypothetical protein